MNMTHGLTAITARAETHKPINVALLRCLNYTFLRQQEKE